MTAETAETSTQRRRRARRAQYAELRAAADEALLEIVRARMLLDAFPEEGRLLLSAAILRLEAVLRPTREAEASR